MVQARPLRDDPVLLGRQQQTEALKVVGSGLDASATGSGKTISTGRALWHRAATTPRLRACVVAEGRLLSQWHDELSRGAPGRGLPLAPNVEPADARRDAPARRPAARLRPPARRASRRRAGRERAVRPPPGRAAGDPLAPARRRRGAPLRQPGHRRPPGAQAGPPRISRRLLALDGDAARQVGRAARRAGRAGARRRGDDRRAAGHARDGRPDRRAQRPPAAGQLRAPRGARHAPGHGRLDAEGEAGRAAGVSTPTRRSGSCSRRSAPAAATPTAGCSSCCAS
jgi:hypothetical protein